MEEEHPDAEEEEEEVEAGVEVEVEESRVRFNKENMENEENKGNEREAGAEFFLQVGQRVRARFCGRGHWYPAAVVAIHGEGDGRTVDLLYDDGDEEWGANPSDVQILGIGRRPQTAPQASAHASPQRPDWRVSQKFEQTSSPTKRPKSSAQRKSSAELVAMSFARDGHSAKRRKGKVVVKRRLRAKDGSPSAEDALSAASVWLSRKAVLPPKMKAIPASMPFCNAAALVRRRPIWESLPLESRASCIERVGSIKTALRRISVLERSCLKMERAKAELEEEIKGLSSKSEETSKSQVNLVKGVKEDGGNEEDQEEREEQEKEKEKEKPEEPDEKDEIESMVRRAKMKILKEALQVDFDAYTLDLAMTLRKIRAKLLSTDNLEKDLRMLAQEKWRADERRRRQRQRQVKMPPVRLRSFLKPDVAAAAEPKNETKNTTKNTKVSTKTLFEALSSHCANLALEKREKQLIATHFDNDGDACVDVEEFIDAVRPPLSKGRQRGVDAAFEAFLQGGEGQQLAVMMDDVMDDVIPRAAVQRAHAAFRSVTPEGHRRGHAALVVVDRWVAKFAVVDAGPGILREEWDRVHRTLSSRIFDDDIFDRVMRSVWAFAAVDGRASPETTMPIVPESSKTWGAYENDDGVPFWACAETGEKTWRQPHVLKRKEQREAAKAGIRRKRATLASLESDLSTRQEQLEALAEELVVEDVSRLRLLVLGKSFQGRIPDAVCGLPDDLSPTHILLDGRVPENMSSWMDDLRSVLEELSMNGCELETLPLSTNGEMQELRVLCASRNLLKSMSNVSMALRHVVHLDLSENRLVEVPQEVAHLEKLERAIFSRNQISSVSASLGSLTSLRRLALDHNHLSVIPSSLAGLTNLEELMLGNNRLSTLPGDLHWKSLRKLLLGNNMLTSVPVSLCSPGLPLLRHLDLSGNQLMSLPNVDYSGLRSLEELHLGQNRLRGLPSTVVQLAQLKTLAVGNNQLRLLPPKLFSMPSLACVLAQRNHLVALPEVGAETSPGLEVLKVHENEIVELPASLGRLSELRALQLAKNRIQELPRSFGQLRHLAELRLDGNILAGDPGLRRVLSDGRYISAREAMLRRSVVKLMDAVKNCWTEVQSRLESFSSSSSSSSTSSSSLQFNPEKVKAYTKGGSLSGSYQRLRRVMLAFDTSGAGMLSRKEFRAVIEGMGMFLSDVELSRVLEFAQESCSSNAGLIDVDAFIHELNRPSAAPTKDGTVAQAVVRYMHDSCFSRASSRAASKTPSNATSVASMRRKKLQNEEELLRAQAALGKTVERTRQLQGYVQGRAPKPEWLAHDGSHRHEEIYRKERQEVSVETLKMQNEKLLHLKRVAQMENRRKEAALRRIEKSLETSSPKKRIKPFLPKASEDKRDVFGSRRFKSACESTLRALLRGRRDHLEEDRVFLGHFFDSVDVDQRGDVDAEVLYEALVRVPGVSSASIKIIMDSFHPGRIEKAAFLDRLVSTTTTSSSTTTSATTNSGHRATTKKGRGAATCARELAAVIKERSGGSQEFLDALFRVLSVGGTEISEDGLIDGARALRFHLFPSAANVLAVIPKDKPGFLSFVSSAFVHSSAPVPVQEEKPKAKLKPKPKPKSKQKLKQRQNTKQQQKRVFQVKVVTADKSCPPFMLTVICSDTIAAVKRKIEFREGLPAERTLLYFAGKRIQDERETIESTGITPSQNILEIVLNQ
eukprot:g4951.t1